MKQPSTNPFVLLLIGLLFLMMQPLAAADRGSLKSTSPNLATREILAAKIKEIEATSDQREEVKTKLVERYRKALSNLDEAKASAECAVAFQNETQRAPEQIQLIREQIQAARGADPLVKLGVTLEMPLEEIQQQLQKEQADLAAVDARRANFEINMLNQELLSQPMRLELLKAKRDQAALQVSRNGMRVKALSEMVDRKRQIEAEQAKIEAE